MIKIINSRPEGGKAGRGHNKTSTFQVIDTYSKKGYMILNHFRFNVGDPESKKRAYKRAEYARDSWEYRSKLKKNSSQKEN